MIVLIIAILAAFALPTYQLNSTQVKIADTISILHDLTTKLLISFGGDGKLPASLYDVNAGGYGEFIVPNKTAFMHYDNGVGWQNPGGMVQLTLSPEIGKAIPGYVASTNGNDGVHNSIVMAFVEIDKGIQIYCGRWDSSNEIYIQLDYLPAGCNTDNIIDLVGG